MDLQKSERDIRLAYKAGFALVALQVLLFLTANLTSTESFSHFRDPLTLLDIAITLLLTIGVYKKNRGAAVSLLIFYVFEIVVSIGEGYTKFSFLSIVFIVLFCYGIRGTFSYRRIMRSQAAMQQRPNIWKYIVLVPLCSIIMIFLVFVSLISLGILPDSEVVEGANLKSYTINRLIDAGIISSDETIIWYYSDGLLSFLEDGNFLTDKRIASYFKEGDSLYHASAYFEEIQSLQYYHSETAWENSLIEITKFDGDYFYLYLPGGDSTSTTHFNALEELWQKNKSEVAPGADEV